MVPGDLLLLKTDLVARMDILRHEVNASTDVLRHEVNASMEGSTRDLQSGSGMETLKALLQFYRDEQRAKKRELRDYFF